MTLYSSNENEIAERLKKKNGKKEGEKKAALSWECGTIALPRSKAEILH